MYVSQIIMLCTLNVYSAVCQLYLNKTGRKNVVYPCYGGLLSNEKEGTIDVHTWLNLKIIMLNERSWRPKENMLYDSSDRKQISNCLRRGGGHAEKDHRRAKENLRG